ncbi:MAG: glycosyltransferase [Aestuariivirgaceae bacterium]|nr:glycosyltransferase [Aestuariivirgaceae bacterium]
MRHFAPLTIIIPAYAAAATLNRTLESVAAAKPQAAEVIVALDGADNAMQAILQNWPAVKVVGFANNRGACAARNLGLKEVTTPYVMFLDADDSISPGLLGHLCWTAQSDDADLAFATHAIEREDGRLTMVEASKLRDARELMDYWLSGKYVPPCSVLWKTEFLRHLGGWDETLAQNQDGDVIHRALYGGARVAWSRAGYGIYVQRDGSTRVSKMMTPQAIESQFQVLERVERMNIASGLVADEDIGKAWYLLASRLYGRGHETHAALALKRARELGFNGHAGTLWQRLAASLLGLGLKSRIINRFRKFIYTILSKRMTMPQIIEFKNK